MKIVVVHHPYNMEQGYFDPPAIVKAAYERLTGRSVTSYGWDNVRRDDPNLVSAVEVLADDPAVKDYGLCVVTIPDGVDWTIGYSRHGEIVEERHRSWFPQ